VSLIVAAALHPMFSVGGLSDAAGARFLSTRFSVAWLPMSLLVMATAGGLAPDSAGGLRDLARRPAWRRSARGARAAGRYGGSRGRDPPSGI
jgi:hypothetical protein